MTVDCASLAAFDLDGTLIRRHSLIRFAARLSGFGGLVRAGVVGLGAAGLPPDRERFKQSALGAVLAGRDIEDVRDQGRRFAADLYRQGLHGSTIEILDIHRVGGSRTVMVTAALDVYAEPLAALLGFDAVLAARVDHVDGRCTGTLTDEGLTGDRKVARLEQWLGGCAGHTRVYAYGDSKDDEPLLAYARATRSGA